MSYKIEKGIKPPSKTTYPFEGMDVGDSFLVTGTHQGVVSACACAYARKFPLLKFTTRTQPDGSVRVWRIK